MKTLKEHIDVKRIPKHIAVIMDGNGRWAKQKGKFRVFGHQSAIKAVRETVETSAELGVKYLTLYAFSTENWNRPKLEVDALMSLLVDALSKELPTMQKNNIRLLTIGNTNQLPGSCQKNLLKAIEATKDNTHMTLILALSYSARWEMLEAVKKIAKDVQENRLKIDEIGEQLFSDSLTTAGIPDPGLMIRTSGEHRISNFLLWQLSYAELYFTNVLWPDFCSEDLYEAIISYQNRERRFGKTSEQLTEKNA